MKEIYTTKMVNTGGRNGESVADDRSFQVKIAPPGSNVADATNPEQLFAAGYSACFNSALDLVKRQKGIKGKSTISVTVRLFEKAAADFILAVEIVGHIDDVSREEALELLHMTHQVCPYSKATAGNIDVEIKAV
ncbi:MAG: organic hydroperoxide resistance protein [Kurthia gibsonii]|uniref:Organic hydroperoxide resistance protein n=1 Tax=Kurthia gibsonii TaxID=33946 RepID=A0ABU9LJV0_9BACL|nr:MULTISPECIES: organic hydroperoxide resistance protein [Kurthia]AMA64530.1 peroxiredoxin, Ohr subfamily protein [Kurthia sp. 11kri321]MEB6112268.1 organic hydroperoxide resistance protein [Kurthia gibsonii]MEB7771039.1 organic hydroperoxide resistance protein [Kurthia gibsonii]RXH51905.1 organic hydroperoxide resistance protein [Kurthia gibsonii]WIL40054.1 organic hydroperoxide resistance protein [Kurthia sp. YJT4]